MMHGQTQIKTKHMLLELFATFIGPLSCI